MLYLLLVISKIEQGTQLPMAPKLRKNTPRGLLGAPRSSQELLNSVETPRRFQIYGIAIISSENTLFNFADVEAWENARELIQKAQHKQQSYLDQKLNKVINDILELEAKSYCIKLDQKINLAGNQKTSGQDHIIFMISQGMGHTKYVKGMEQCS